MAEAVGSAFVRVSLRTRGRKSNPKNDNAAEGRGVVSINNVDSIYFETDFLNMRSIFSFVASQQAWLA